MAASDAGAGAGVEAHQRESPEAEGEEKNVKHGGSLPDEGRPGQGDHPSEGRKGAIRNAGPTHKGGVKAEQMLPRSEHAGHVRAACFSGGLMCRKAQSSVRS